MTICFVLGDFVTARASGSLFQRIPAGRAQQLQPDDLLTCPDSLRTRSYDVPLRAELVLLRDDLPG